jgi:cytochrome c biogenesis protein CcmG/thiol:disulfide interchange protein DsbE
LPRQLKLGAQGLALACVAGLLGLLVWKLAHQPHVPKGAAPNFSLPRLDQDGRLQLASLRGQAVVLNFWASWCVPCKAEAPLFEAAWQRWRGRGVVVIGIDSEDFSGDARRFARHFGLSYPLVRDGSPRTKDSYGVTGFPETFFVNRKGRLVGHIAGPIAKSNAPALNGGIRRALAS